MRLAWAVRVCSVLTVSACVSACAAHRFVPPADAGTPLPDAVAIHAAVSSTCRGVRTMTAELGLSGRVGSERVRGRVVSGFRQPDAMRLEGVAPFGPPAFVLVSTAGSATLVLPRDNAVLMSARPADVLEALTGVALEPADLLALLTGCVIPAPTVASGLLYRDGSASLSLVGDATLYLRRQQRAWQVRAARRGAWQVEYEAWDGSFPSTVRLQRLAPDRVAVDLTAVIAQRESNVEIETTAFTVVVPPGARSIDVADLRASGPLRGQP